MMDAQIKAPVADQINCADNSGLEKASSSVRRRAPITTTAFDLGQGCSSAAAAAPTGASHLAAVPSLWR